MKRTRTSSDEEEEDEGVVLDARECVRLVPCSSEADLSDTGSMPLYLHHFFEDETIKNWSTCTIRVYYTTSSMALYIDVTGDAGEEATDILDMFDKVPYPGGRLKSMQAFMSQLKKDVDLPETYEVESSFTCKSDNYDVISYNPSDPLWHQHHRRVEWFSHFFIEAASEIEVDHRWRVYEVLLRRPPNAFSVVGMMSVYDYWCLPLHRTRISQVYVFDEYQSMGMAARMLTCVQRKVMSDQNTQEITVEDPALSFSQLRDYVLLRTAVEENIISKADLNASTDVAASMARARALGPSFASKLKTPVLEASRLCHIMSLAAVVPDDMTMDMLVAPKELDDEVPRDWRGDDNEMPSKLMDVLSSEDMKPVREDVKRNYLSKHSNLVEVSRQELHWELQKVWIGMASGYLRTIAKLRSV